MDYHPPIRAISWQANLERGDFVNPSQLDAPFGLATLGTCAVPALTDALADENWWMRAAAATALAKMDPLPQTTMPALIETLKCDSEYLRAWAAIALRHKSSDDARHALAQLQETMH